MHDNATPHKARLTETFLVEHDIERILQPPYSPDMNFCDHFIFRNMKVARKDIIFYNLDDALEFVNNFLATLNRPTLTRHLQCFWEDPQMIIDNERLPKICLIV